MKVRIQLMSLSPEKGLRWITYVVSSQAELFLRMMSYRQSRHIIHVEVYDKKSKDSPKTIAAIEPEGAYDFWPMAHIRFTRKDILDNDSFDSLCGRIWEVIEKLPISKYDRTGVKFPSPN